MCRGVLIFHMQEHVAVWRKSIEGKDQAEALTDKPAEQESKHPGITLLTGKYSEKEFAC